MNTLEWMPTFLVPLWLQVMWRPSYQAVWRQRVDALQDVRTMRETLSFAERNRIDYIVGDCQAFRAVHIEPVFRKSVLCVSAASNALQQPH